MCVETRGACHRGHAFCAAPLLTSCSVCCDCADDNFFVRNLNGFPAYWLPPGAITSGHLARAVDVLLQFDVVLILSEMGEHLEQLVHTFGWNRARVKSTSPISSNGGYTPNWHNFTREQKAWLLELNRWDLALFDVARRRARELSDVAKQTRRETDLR